MADGPPDSQCPHHDLSDRPPLPHDLREIQPYAKGLIGFGQFNYPYNLGTDNDFVVAPGGGLDFRVTKRIRIRVADFEYQIWPGFHYGTLTSYGLSTGIRVRIF